MPEATDSSPRGQRVRFERAGTQYRRQVMAGLWGTTETGHVLSVRDAVAGGNAGSPWVEVMASVVAWAALRAVSSSTLGGPLYLGSMNEFQVVAAHNLSSGVDPDG